MDETERLQLDDLRGQVAQFRLICNNVPVAIAYYDRDGYTCRYANAAYARMFGSTEAALIGLTVEQIIGPEAAALIQPQVDHVLESRRGVHYERLLPIAPDGPMRSVEVHLLPHCEDTSEPLGAFVLISDITRHRQSEAALRESEERLAKFMHASAEGIVFHKGGLITDVNPPLLALLGQTLPDMMGRPTLDFIAPAHRAKVAEVIAAGSEISYDSMALHRSGDEIPVEFIVRTMQHHGQPLRMTIVRDIRDRLEAQARIQHLATHDALTGLPNRSAFDERAEALLAAAARSGQTVALLFIDLDHFKRVNDSLGHPVGDVLLQTVARRITAVLRGHGGGTAAAEERGADLVARFGGDEFVLLLAGNPTSSAVQEVTSKLVAAVSAPLLVEGVTLSVTPSIGVALYPEHGSTAAELVKHADIALYHAKGQGRATGRFFEPAMAAAARAELAMEGELAEAVREGQFVLHYQPELGRGGELCGVEALLRWQHPVHGLVGPDDFIALSEARRLILPIGAWALRQALQSAVRWRDQGLLGPGAVRVAVNLSMLQFRAPGFVDGIAAALQAAGAPGSLLELELTERMLMEDVDTVRAVLLQLQGLGVGIAVDDFGTGYTSLRHLKHLPVQRVKIDRSFVADLPGDGASAAIARAIIQMAHALGMHVLAEGVETDSQQQWLLDEGCDGLQGFAVVRPMAEAALLPWLARRRG